MPLQIVESGKLSYTRERAPCTTPRTGQPMPTSEQGLPHRFACGVNAVVVQPAEPLQQPPAPRRRATA
eukprot:15472510-Alexandrium_andersonii.AAC.1